MEELLLRHTALNVSRVAMGGCPMGGHGWGAVDETSLVEAVHAAMDGGIRFFDTADVYGLGASERTLGKALQGRRNQAFIATKFGVRVENGMTWHDNRPEWIRSAVESSLQRLGTDWIDLYQVHYRDGKTPLSEVAGMLERLQAEGLIRHYGLSNIHMEDAGEIQPYVGQFVSFQDEYSLACREGETEMLSLATELELTPMTWGSLGQGILSGKYDRLSVFPKEDRRSREIYRNFHGERLEKNLRIVDVLREIAAETGRTLPAVAIRFILQRLPGSVVLVGIKNRGQLASNLDAGSFQLGETQMERLLQVSIQHTDRNMIAGIHRGEGT